MADDFDPYHQWLGIPPQDQPPNHYRLLGLRLGESNPQVIADAAQWQAVIVGTCESGPHGDHVPRLLQEIAAAQACLLDPAARSAHDATLYARPKFRLRSLFPASLLRDAIIGGIVLLVPVLVALLVREIWTRDRSAPDAVAGSRDARAVEPLAPPTNSKPPVAPSAETVRRPDSSSPLDLTPAAEMIFGAQGGPNQPHDPLADTAPSSGPPLEEMLLRWQLKLSPPRETREPPEVAQARSVLAQNPQDEISRSTLGRYDCFVKGDWDSGLRHLLSCSDRDLAELARQDATQPRLPGEMVKLADAWYAWGRNAGEVARQGAWFRALTWYRKAAPCLPKPATQRIEQRIAEMAAVLGAAGLVPTVRSPRLDIPPGEVRSFAGHEDNVTALAVAPSGVLLASAAEDRTVRMWNLLTGEQIWKQETKSSHLTGVVITPDLQCVVSNFDDQQFAEMQAGDGRIRRYVGHSPTSPIGLCLTPEGLLIWAARSPPPNLIVWGLAQNRAVGRHGDGDCPTALDLSPDGRRIATGDARGVVRVWDTRTGESLGNIVTHKDAITDIDLSSDGRHVATASRHEIRILEFPSPEPVHTFCVESVRTVAFSPDGRRLASGGAREEILLWDVITGRRYETIQAAAALTDREITCIAFLPDPRGLVTGATGGKIRLWRLAD